MIFSHLFRHQKCPLLGYTFRMIVLIQFVSIITNYQYNLNRNGTTFRATIGFHSVLHLGSSDVVFKFSSLVLSSCTLCSRTLRFCVSTALVYTASQQILVPLPYECWWFHHPRQTRHC